MVVELRDGLFINPNHISDLYVEPPGSGYHFSVAVRMSHGQIHKIGRFGESLQALRELQRIVRILKKAEWRENKKE